MYTPGKKKNSRSNNWGGNNTKTLDLETLDKNQPNKIL